MRFGMLIAIVCGLAACGNKDADKMEKEAPGSGTGSASASAAATAAASGTATAAGTGSATTAPPAGDACGAACAHRASCGLGDAAACATDCGALLALGTLEESGLQSYAALSCDKVKESEPQFQIGAACHKACTHRSSCIAGASAKDCIPDCAALVVVSKQEPATAVAGYLAKDCAAVQADEPVLGCLRACRHVLECGVPGDLETCLGQCGQRLQAGTTLAELAQVEALSCEDVKKTITISSGDAGGGGSHLCTAEGSYTSCASGCRDAKASATGLADNVEDARMLAKAKCTSSMRNSILLSPAGSRAAVKSACAITSCN